MRRGSCGGIGMGQGGYNKPPPTPIVHGNLQGPRVRVHPMDGNVPNTKGHGGQRERSPSFGSGLPHSPLHFGGREKSPNPTNLTDCSKSLLAHIQSLNSVCSTACRLSQCLAQVASDSCVDDCQAGQQWTHIVRESADLWEGIARALEIANASAGSQVIALLQEIQMRPNEYSDLARRQEIAKIVHSMLQMFLNLQCQFSFAVLERFSGVLHALGPEGFTGYPNTMPMSHLPQTLNAQQILLQQQKHQILHQQLSFQHHIMQLNQQKNLATEGLLKEEQPFTSSHPPSTPGSPWSRNPGSPVSAASSSPNVNASQSRHNSLSPGLLTAGGGSAPFNEWNSDATLRRWSMGGPTDGWAEKANSLAPFAPFANRRWSVPETSDDPSSSSFGSSQMMYDTQSRDGSFKGSRSSGIRANSLGSQSEPVVRSHSNSPSTTPGNRSGSVASDELQSVVDLLSLPMLSECPKPHSNASSNLSPNSSFAHDTTDDIKVRKNIKTAQRPTNSKTLSYSGESSGSEPITAVVGDDITQKDRPLSWSDGRLSQEQIGKNPDDGKSQISTPLWPPTETVPGVTLTECSGEEENPIIQGWNDRDECEAGNNFSRDSPNRASWPVASSINRFTNNGTWDVPEELIGSVRDTNANEGGWPPCSTPTFRRHSTDAPYLLPQTHSLFASKTRSFENLTKTDSSKSSLFDSNIQNLLYMGSLQPNISSPTSESQYSLFTQTN